MNDVLNNSAIIRLGEPSSRDASAELVGAKFANLARMAALGLPVPPAFVLPVAACVPAASANASATGFRAALAEGIAYLEDATGKGFGDRRRPLLVSVRSGAPCSMPGMLDTVLDVGCTLSAAHGLIRTTGNPRFAWDCRRRWLEGHAATVLGLDAKPFAAALARAIAEEGVASEYDLDCEALERLASRYESMIEDAEGRVADDALEQLEAAVQAVCRSWMSDRARTYRAIEKLDHLQGTAVTVQAMVFGNRGLTSGSGVAFSRNPSTGEREPLIELLFDAQGEDVVSGRRTPETEESLARLSPAVADQLRQALASLEREFGDVQDVEFTIEDGKLWMLQTRDAKRTPRAALRFAVDFVHEGRISPDEGLRRLSGLDLAALAVTRFAGSAEPFVRGIGASAGVAFGRVAWDAAAAERLSARGDPVVLVRPSVSTDDIAGFRIAAGIVTCTGGRTAHASLVARQMAKPCVVGCEGLVIEPGSTRASAANRTVEEGDWISIDGDSGEVFAGRREIATERPAEELAEVERWRSSAQIASAASTGNRSASRS